MQKCGICGKLNRRGGLSFFRVPIDVRRRTAWSKATGVSNWETKFVCVDHFLPGDIIPGKRIQLTPSAVPSINIGLDLQFRSNTNAVKKIKSTMPNSDTESSISYQSLHINSTSQELKLEKDELINEALFDNEDNASQIKSRQVFISMGVSKSIQTNEPTEDHMSCGFVNISKTGPDKYFHLRCFYCDAEFPISFWSEFSDHIISNHGNLENDFYENDDVKSIATEKTFFDGNIDESAKEKETTPINFVNINDFKSNKENLSLIDKEHKVSELTETLLNNSNSSEAAEQYSYKEKYENNSEHSYNQNEPNDEFINDIAHTDEITFEKTPRHIIIDFLDNLKGFPSLWHDFILDSEIHEKDLRNVMRIMRLKWELNLKVKSFRRNLEDIKAWFNTTKATKIKEGHNKVDHAFPEYYKICSEFLYCEKVSQYHHRCNMCNMAFSNVILLRVHKVSKHKIGPLPFNCNKCRKQFIYIDNLLKHLPKHSIKNKKQTFECYECHKTFSCTNEYKMHLDLHPHGDCPFACEECGKRFKNQYSRNAHQKHHKSTGYQCELCPLKLSNSFTFKCHMAKHKRNYEYVCEWCGRAFVCRNHWTEHRKFAHMGHGVCKICNREYKKRIILHKHLVNLHKPTFGTNEELSKRCRKAMNPNFRKYEYVVDPLTQIRRLKCPLCDKTFLRHRNVGMHALKIHNYDCRNLKRGKQVRPPNVQKSMKTESFDKTVNKINGSNNSSKTAKSGKAINKKTTNINKDNSNWDDTVMEKHTNSNFCLKPLNSFVSMDDQLSEKFDTSMDAKDEACDENSYELI